MCLPLVTLGDTDHPVETEINKQLLELKQLKQRPFFGGSNRNSSFSQHWYPRPEASAYRLYMEMLQELDICQQIQS